MRRLKVLIADDHRLMLHSIRVALEADGEIEIVAEVDSGTKVIPFIGQTGPDLVLLDIRMPGIDGLTVLERIRERYPHVKVAILSGVDDPSVIQAAFDRERWTSSSTSIRAICPQRCGRPSRARSFGRSARSRASRTPRTWS